jgi:hypothetical protein
MNRTRSRLDTYERLGSVFTVARGILPGSLGTVANDQSFDLAVVRFNDDGTFVNSGELKAATDCIERARRASNDNGAIVVVFIHGWHHGVSWDISTNDGDDHFREFRRILMTLALRELERWGPNGTLARRVVGVYVSWNGDPHGWPLSRVPVLTHLTFWNRYGIARSVGAGQAMRDAIASIVSRTKAPLQDKPLLAESPLILIGHSMGALMLETAFLSLLREQPESLIQSYEGKAERPVEIMANGKAVTFPDLVLLLNSAADSRIAKRIVATLKQMKVRKSVRSEKFEFLPPLLVSATSPRDMATRVAWRLGNLPWRKTDGHDASLYSHVLENTDEEAVCKAVALDRIAQSFGQPWHCLRPPVPAKADYPTFSIDLPKAIPLRENEFERPQHRRYVLKPLARKNGSLHAPANGAIQDDPHPFWIFRMPPDISASHNDIFNFRSSLLILALIQISGAVMSLANKWEEVFE